MKHLRSIFVLLLVILSISALVQWLSRSKPVVVVVQQAEVGMVMNTVSNTRAGTVKACRRAGISPSVGGQITQMPVKEGDRVEQNQVLMVLWNDDQLAQLTLARRESESAKASAEQVCIMAAVSKKESHRQQQLMKKGLTSEEQVDKAYGEAHAQQAACTAAQATYQVSQARINVVVTALERSQLTAPFAGIVAEINGEIGEFVTPSPVGIPTPPAVDLIDISCLYISAPIDEVDAPQIRVGMPANISLDAMPKQIFKGQVRRIAPYVLEMEKQARTVAVEVDFLCQEECQQMLPGYSADIEVILQQSDDTLRIPSEAILEGNRVLLLIDGQLQQRTIETGLSNWAWSEVTDGLSVGDEVVLSVEREGVEDGADAVRERQATAE
ncbi:MAG: efflux RND transporter periplasmic adaptor subunit [Candidatus Polarisedimenticolaceae bacterium]|nr:efflux RND transporter periplasmic adaptor subunit [Candidatus Polarisedimenticolaceae bacterium]